MEPPHLSPVTLGMNSKEMDCYCAKQMVYGVLYHLVTSKVYSNVNQEHSVYKQFELDVN